MNDSVVVALISAVGGIITAALSGIFALLLAQRKDAKVVAVHVAEVAVKAEAQANRIEEIHGLVNNSYQEALREIINLKGLINRQNAILKTRRASDILPGSGDPNAPVP